LDGNGTNRDGASPLGGLILTGDTLYGTAYLGGTNGNGTVFRVNTDGSGFLTLHHFSAGANNASGVFTNGDGVLPYGGVTLSGSTLYGTTQEGGRFGYGTVFAIQTNGTGFTNLYQFTDGTDGGQPQDSLILSGGTLYGTAIGAVFKVNTNGTGFASLYNGDDFSAGLILSGDGGTLYGTARVGGAADGGAIFAVGTNLTGFTNLYSFTATAGTAGFNFNGTNSDGDFPFGGLLLAGNLLYGTASGGGLNGDGTVYSYSLPGPVLPFRLSLPQLTGGNTNLTFLLSGPAGSNYVLQVSTNLSNWNPVSTSAIPFSGTVNLTNATGGDDRQFYRAVIP
jgi:uncharacterized repeat protein (TIGR03803 family)